MNAGIKLAVAWLLLPGSLAAQSFLEQFSYEGLRLSGIGFEFGAVVSDRLTTEPTGALRIDYGYIAPKVRVLIGGSYFKGAFNSDEIARFEDQLRRVVIDPTLDFVIDVGTISWADFEGSLDLQYVFSPTAQVIPYVGLGLGVHVRDADGTAIEDTFVEDAATRMEIVDAPDEIPPVQQEVQAVVSAAEGKSWPMGAIERHQFYERAKKAYCVIATGETRFYGCFAFTKGVVPPDA